MIIITSLFYNVVIYEAAGLLAWLPWVLCYLHEMEVW